ncbi:MAG TPA: aminoglycoside phosphotransferase family protein [Humibacter sp.]|nr:aminoglycoside phosphotransferase family protein [Humibacter sp.]
MESIASGRSADVFDLGGGRVLRRYRDERTSHDEARLMVHLHTLGYPVPLVHESSGRDLVMEHIAGPTLFEELLHEPGQVERYGRLLGELHDRLHRIPAPEWLIERESTETPPAGARIPEERHPVVVHRDLHPLNVILSERGPVVIDWEGAGAGSASFDVALTVVVTMGSDLEPFAGGADVRRLDASRGLFVEAFLRSCRADPAPGLAAALRYRATHAALSESEQHWLADHGPSCLDRFRF